VKDDAVVVNIGVVMMKIPVPLMKMHLHIAAVEAPIQANQRITIVGTAIAVGLPRGENGKGSMIGSVE
jgi:hypothetical protein